MKHPINTWTYKQIEFWRKQPLCIGKQINYVFTNIDRQQAITKLQTFYKGKIENPFAEKILYASELY